MYTSGLNPKIKELYPKIKFPVSRGTPSIYDLPFWDHSEKWTDGLNDFVSKTLMEETNKIIYSRLYIYTILFNYIFYLINMCILLNILLFITFINHYLLSKNFRFCAKLEENKVIIFYTKFSL